MTEKIRISSLEFNDIKSGLINYLRDQPDFTDYDFSASGLSVLVNLLAYNTHYQSLLANYTANELFIDTASKRSSIVSRAKELGYVPYSTRAPKAVINLVVSNVSGNPSSLVLPEGSQFITTVNDNEYIFTTTKSYSAVNVTNVFTFSNVEIYEGSLIQNSTGYGGIDPTIDIPNVNIDTNTLSVMVRENLSDDYVEFDKATSFLDLNADSKVYFLQETSTGQYGIYFGDNVIGHQPVINSAVVFVYVTSNGPAANDASVFSLITNVAGFSGATKVVNLVSKAAGGQYREGAVSIKHNSLNFYGTQNRAVVANDYTALIGGAGVPIKSVVTWGGEDNVPPQYNTIFFCVQPAVGDIITETDKTTIEDFFNRKAVGNMNFKFVDPEYLDVKIATEVTYDKNVIVGSVYALETSVKNSIASFVNTVLTHFDGSLKYSQLSRNIDNTDNAIISSSTIMSLIKEVIPIFYTKSEIKFSVLNVITQETVAPAVTSSGFYIEDDSNIMFFEDDKAGKLKIVYYVGSIKNTQVSDAGTVNYITGDIYVNPITVSGTVENKLYFYIKQKANDIYAKQHIIPRIQNSNITVTSKAE